MCREPALAAGAAFEGRWVRTGRDDGPSGPASPRGRRRGRDAPHVVVDVADADVQELGRLRLADGALREGAQAEPASGVPDDADERASQA